MSSLFEKVKEFHHKFDVHSNPLSHYLPEEVYSFRIRFLHEELNEYKQAVLNQDLPGQLDALVDLVYVALGTAHLQGFNFDEAFEEVHTANLKKIKTNSSDKSKRNYAGDIIKPPGWTKPDLTQFIWRDPIDERTS